MSLKILLEFRHTLAFHLTLWYTGVFSASFLGVFIVCYIWLSSSVYRNIDQDLANEWIEFRSILTNRGMEEVKKAIELEAESEGEVQHYFRLFKSDGTILFFSNMASWNRLGADLGALKQLAKSQKPVFKTVSVPQRHHGARVLYDMIGPDIVLEAGISLEENEEFLGLFKEVFSSGMLFFLISGTLVGWFLARRALLGVEEVTTTAQKITGGVFGQRVPLTVKKRGAEIDRLAKTFNDMLDRIQALMKGMRETNDNIAHDLRSPLTRIRGIAEMALTGGGQSIPEYEAAAAKTIEECDRLLEMINTMLEISETEAGAIKLKTEELDLVRLVRDAVELFLPVAEDKRIDLSAHFPESCYFNGDLQRLQRMLANLLDNALKYTPAGGKVSVTVTESENKILITVQDTGVGIDEHDLPHIFERFYRCDPSRSQPGIGLGLSLSLAIARAHGGDIKVTSISEQGSVFDIFLPLHLF
jgi:signal transduction histidine kinase